LVEALPPSEKKVTISFLLKRFVQGAGLDGIARHRLWVSNIPPTLLARLGLAPAVEERPNTDAGHLLDQVQRWDLETMLAEGLLTKADRASMSSALELRTPFLDAAVMEFALSLPVAERVQGFNTKVFLKRYALNYLPKAIVRRRKRGLSVPTARWLRGPLHEWAFHTLGSGRLERVGIDTSAAMSLLCEHSQRKADHARALWTLLVLSEWLDWVAQETDSSAALPSGCPGVTADCDTRRVAHVS
jgi:asparagine synthase (glutamine-hydrolysing)